MPTPKPNGQEPAAPQTELSRDLSCFTITMIGVGAMIGAGIFVLTGIAAGAAGPALILAFALNGVVTIFTAMVYAELGSAIPEAGGGYLWVSEGLPGGNAFLAGWMSWFAHAVAGSLYALGFGAYAGLVLSDLHMSIFGLDPTATSKVIGVAAALFFVFINYRGASETGVAGNIVTVAKVVVIGIFIAAGLFHIVEHPEYLHKIHPFAPKGFSGVLIAMGLTFIAFEGYEIIVQAGEEVKDPRRNVPRAVFWSIAIVIPIYILVAFVALAAVNTGGMPTWQWLGAQKELGIAEAARQFMPFGTAILLIGGLLSTLSALNATTFSSTRVSFAMGRARNLPDAFAKIHPKTRTPIVALLASGTIIVLMVLAVPIEDVAAAADIMFLLLFLQVNVAVISIRKKYGDKLVYGYLTPFFPLVPILGIGAQFLLALFMFHYSPLAWIVALGWIAAGVFLYYFYARSRDKEKVTTPIVGTVNIPKKKERFRILLPVANPETAEGLARFAARLARLRDAEVIVLHCITAPRQLPLSGGRSLLKKASPAADRAVRFLRNMGIPTSSVIRMTHAKIWRGIVDTVEEYDVDFLIMGWRGRPGDPRTHVGRNEEEVIARANCQTAVLQNPSPTPVSKVLVPVEEHDRGHLLLEVASLLVKPAPESRIDLLHVTPPHTLRDEKTKKTALYFREVAREMKETVPGAPEIRYSTAEASSAAEEILHESASYDTIVVGAARKSWLRRRLLGSTLRRVSRGASCPVVLVSGRTAAVKFGVQALYHFFQAEEGKAEANEGVEKGEGD